MRLLRRSFHSLLAITDEFRIYCDEITRLGRVMAQGLGNSKFIARNFRIPK